MEDFFRQNEKFVFAVKDFKEVAPQTDQPTVPVVRVSFIKTVNLLPHQSIIAPVQVKESPQLIEQSDCFAEGMGIQIEDTLVQSNAEGVAFVTLCNPHAK